MISKLYIIIKCHNWSSVAALINFSQVISQKFNFIMINVSIIVHMVYNQNNNKLITAILIL